jgi:hypothetical protein
MRASMSAAMPTMPSAGTMQASGAAGKAAAMDASVPKMTGAQTDASTAPASNAECTKLSTCCGGLMDDDDRSDCQELVMRNDAMRCTRASAELCQMPTMPSTPSEACMKLSTCCATLGRAPLTRDCEQTVERADAERCTRQLDQRCPELAPVPQEPACATLHACCPKLMEPQLEVCRRALQDGDQRDCARASMQLCQ